MMSTPYKNPMTDCTQLLKKMLQQNAVHDQQSVSH